MNCRTFLASKRAHTLSARSKLLTAIVTLVMGTSAFGATVDFDDVSPALGPNSSFGGPTANAVPGNGPFGDSGLIGTFTSGGVQFTNTYDTTFNEFGNGFAYSNMNDTTTPGPGNQFSAITGVGAGSGLGGNADNYGIASGFLDQTANSIQPFNFNPSDASQLAQLPHFQLPAGSNIASMEVTNTTYAALIMELGDPNGIARQFGTGDFFKLTAYGTDAAGHVLSAAPSIYLANFLTANGGGVVTSWENFNLSALSGAKTVYFNLSSSDVGQFGMNTPGYFALDNIVLTSAANVPEPSSLGLALLAGLGVAAAAWRAKRPVAA